MSIGLELVLTEVKQLLEERRAGRLSEHDRALLELRKVSSVLTVLEKGAVDSVKKNLLSEAKGRILLASLLLDCDTVAAIKIDVEKEIEKEI